MQDVRDYLLGVESVVPFRSGNVSSPNYPNKYPDGLEKTELIQVEQGKVLSLEFTAFDIASSKKCKNDYLSIQDADGTVLMGKRCGSNLPAKITSRTNTVYVFFKTNKYKASTGWSIFWRDSSSEDAQVVSSGKRSN